MLNSMIFLLFMIPSKIESDPIPDFLFRSSFCVNEKTTIYAHIELSKKEILDILRKLDNTCYNLNYGCATIVRIDGEVVDYECTPSSAFFRW